jgi:Tol biopolymer transport system component
MPMWSPDGRAIAFRKTLAVTTTDGNAGLFRKSADGTGATDTITTLGADIEDWSRDGRFLVTARIDPVTNRDLWIIPLDNPTRPMPFARTQSNEIQGQLSPDGRWMAYVSDEPGASNVFVQGFPTGPRSRVSTTRGAQPRWRRDGKELFYLDGDGTLMAVGVSAAGAQLALGTPTPLFKTRLDAGSVMGSRANYDVSADGSRFLLNDPLGDTSNMPDPVVLLSWPALLKK